MTKRELVEAIIQRADAAVQDYLSYRDEIDGDKHRDFTLRQMMTEAHALQDLVTSLHLREEL